MTQSTNNAASNTQHGVATQVSAPSAQPDGANGQPNATNNSAQRATTPSAAPNAQSNGANANTSAQRPATQSANNSASSAQHNANNSAQRAVTPSTQSSASNNSASGAPPDAANTSAQRTATQSENNSESAPRSNAANNSASSAPSNATNNSAQRAVAQSANTSAPSTQSHAANNSASSPQPKATNNSTPSTQSNSASSAQPDATHASAQRPATQRTNNSALGTQPNVSPPRVATPQPEVTLVNRVLPGDVKLFEPEGSPGGCASGECLVPPPLVLEEQEPEPEAPPLPTNHVGDDEKWRRAVDAVRTASPRHGKSLSYARFLGFTPEGVKLAFPTDAAFHRAQVIGLSRAMIEAELARSLGRPIKVSEDTNAAALQSAPKSIAEVEATDRNTRERSIEEKVRMHPALRNVLKHLGGNLEHISYLEPTPKKLIAADEGDASPPVD